METKEWFWLNETREVSEKDPALYARSPNTACPGLHLLLSRMKFELSVNGCIRVYTGVYTGVERLHAIYTGVLA